MLQQKFLHVIHGVDRVRHAMAKLGKVFWQECFGRVAHYRRQGGGVEESVGVVVDELPCVKFESPGSISLTFHCTTLQPAGQSYAAGSCTSAVHGQPPGSYPSRQLENQFTKRQPIRRATVSR